MMIKQIFCEENQKNNNAENFESENITVDIKNKLETILEYGKKYKCRYLFYSLDLLINFDINNRILLSFDKAKEKMPDIPDYCEKEYNIFYNEKKEEFKNERNMFKLKFDLGESGVDVDYNTDKNNKEYVDNDKKKNKSYDDELEQYYLKSRKDCVEYGLKSSNKDLIVCTKYE